MHTSLPALLLGWLLDLCLGDPARLPHPVVGFGKAIAACERRWNRGPHRRLKGALVALGLVLATYVLTALLCQLPAALAGLAAAAAGQTPPPPAPCPALAEAAGVLIRALLIFFCLAGTTLIREVRAVFLALDRSVDEGRRQVARIVGRDTSQLSAQEVRTAALETLAENLNDGVVAPLFWLALLGVPGMVAYKMVNTLDSMIGYRTERYRDFGCWAARMDDVAGYLPARLTALLMVLAATLQPGRRRPRSLAALLAFVRRYGRCHASPNSGYPEAALAAVLGCRFGGPHYYFGQLFDKPFIGEEERELTTADMRLAVGINRCTEVMMVALTAAAVALNPLA